METGCRGWAKSSLLWLLHPCPLAAVTWGVQGRGLDSTGDRTSSHWHSLIVSDVIHDVIIWGQAGTGAAGLLLGWGFLLYLDHLGLKPRPQGVVTHVHVLINLQEATRLRGPGGRAGPGSRIWVVRQRSQGHTCQASVCTQLCLQVSLRSPG